MTEIEILYALISLFAILSSVLIFVQRKLLHAAIALALAFVASALLFAAIGQVFIGLLQLLIFVGGLAAYLIAAVATEVKERSMLKPATFAAVAVLLSASFTMIALSLPVYSYSNSVFQQSAIVLFAGDYVMLFVIAMLLFSTAIGSVLIIKKLRKLVI